ncbi:DNA polymerase-4 [Blastomonas natatoria]|uniref:DNA polymerase IV n=1 Tax=Blastomonas natatoria TaxID=34015 RepID=A0A2V3V0I7_9SPHN|nr:DNA polymerase IV [Blastomonas natatoria]PXW75252.1 DNA polymerase-4 [Blastomonas natatoria]
MEAASDPPLRKIIHIDMDAFFASVEQRDNPDLRGLPVAVGGSSRRGVVAAASYEARAFGVRSAMPSVTALRRCPDLVFVKPRFDVYQSVSRQIREIFAQHTDQIEPLSLDEAYLDVTINKQAIVSATHIAEAIRAQIRRETGLTASAGVSYNKFIAKLASDQNKPDGLCVIRPEKGPGFVAGLPVKRFHGVGPRTAEKMEALGIVTGADLASKSEPWLLQHFGSWGSYLFGAARGIDNRPVRPDRIRKSIGGERTYGEDIWTEDALRSALEQVADIVWERVERADAQGRTVTLKARFADFHTITRARSLSQPVQSRAVFAEIGHALVEQILPLHNGVRLLGLTLSGLSRTGDEEAQDMRQPELPFA